MFEQDIELARLLIAKCQASQNQRDELQAALTERAQELEQQQSLKREREGYADVMAKAASLLERPDLQIALPDTTELETQVSELEEQANTASEQAAQFEELLDELASRAPEIVEKARAEAEEQQESRLDESAGEPEPEETSEPVGDAVEKEPTDDPGDAELPSTDETAAEDNASVDAEPEEEAYSQDRYEAGEETNAYDAGNLLKRFNLHALKTKEAFTYGRGAAYLVDASTVLERVPNYDIAIRGGEESTLRDELLRDLDHLSKELSGTFYAVFESWYHPLISVGNRVGAIYTTGELEGTRDGARQRTLELANELKDKHRTICIVTSDDDLAKLFEPDSVFIISLAEFFNF